MEGSSSVEDELEDATHQMWDQLLAANMLPPDVVASGITVTDDVLRAIYPALMKASLPISPPDPVMDVPAVFNSDTARPAPWEMALARDVAEARSPYSKWSVPHAGGGPPPVSKPVSVLVATKGSSDVLSAPPADPATRTSVKTTTT